MTHIFRHLISFFGSVAPWPDCASLGDAKLNDTDTDNGTEYTATLEQCSYDCTADSQVQSPPSTWIPWLG